MLSSTNVRRLALVLFFISVILVVMTLFMGFEIKGARRWLSFAGFSIQPSEFLKPAFAVLSAWIFAQKHYNPDIPGVAISSTMFLLVVSLLLLQPDLGMVVLISAVWLVQFFIAGLSIFWIFMAACLGALGLFLSYMFLPHVTRRLDQFFDPSMGDKFSDKYQITQSLEAFMNGGIMGQGPGEGVVKKHLPDAHADFVFAVVGEEFGLILCLIIAGLFVFIVLRSLLQVFHENNLFGLLAVTGLVIEFGLQAMINMASALSLIPTKGMTLPFISYGGSSIVALAITMGMILAFTRR